MAADASPAELEWSFLSRSPEETEWIGAQLGARLPPGAVVALAGELGTGKTCFVRGLARGLGVSENVTSPTYALMHTYAGRLPLYHYDAWMADRARAFLEGGGIEWMLGEGAAAVEWADRVSEVLPRPRIEIRFLHAAESRRWIALAVLSEVGCERGQPSDLCRALVRACREVALSLPEPPGAARVEASRAHGARRDSTPGAGGSA